MGTTTVFQEISADTILRVFHNIDLFAAINNRGSTSIVLDIKTMYVNSTFTYRIVHQN